MTEEHVHGPNCQHGHSHGHSHSSSEGINLAHIFEEYWVYMVFGFLFLMTVLAPLLFMGDLKWFIGSVITVVVCIVVILAIPLLCKGKMG